VFNAGARGFDGFFFCDGEVASKTRSRFVVIRGQQDNKIRRMVTVRLVRYLYTTRVKRSSVGLGRNKKRRFRSQRRARSPNVRIARDDFRHTGS